MSLRLYRNPFIHRYKRREQSLALQNFEHERRQIQMKLRNVLILTLAISLLLSGCVTDPTPSNPDESSAVTSESTPPTTSADESHIAIAEQLAQSLLDGVYSFENFTAEMTAALPPDALQQGWETLIADYGDYVETEDVVVTPIDVYQSVELLMVFEEGGVICRVTVDGDGKVAGLGINPYIPERLETGLPETLTEEDVTVATGRFELDGKLTMGGETPSDTAVVLVHGSGPQDMDETIMEMSKPFRDIAYGLAEQGIDVLRYDKRTYAYSGQFTEQEMQVMTVREETIDDAVSAVKLLADRGYEKIYVVGHSLGGMLAPRIYEASGQVDGLVIMAGSTRTLTDIVTSQTMAQVAGLTETEQAMQAAAIEGEKAKLESLDSLTEEELHETLIFGMPAYYIKELNSHDTAEIAAGLDCPILVMQGELDFQVYADVDYPLWQTALADNPEAEFKLYDGLTHLFIKAPENPTMSVQDYVFGGTVEQQVIDDIAEFLR